MPFYKSSDDSELSVLAVTSCCQLRSKGMYVTGKLVPTRETDGMGDGYCWCNMTQRVVGPDNDMVERRSCKPGRSCYQDVI